MKILLTNDDGIEAPGIRALHDALIEPRSLGEVVTIAPMTVQSASSHGITFHSPLLTRTVRVHEKMQGIAVEGRPADCVKVALRAIWQERFGPGTRPDLTISGMNMGANVGINVIYSGTVAAAVESAFLGVPAIAVSLHLGPASQRRKTDYEWAAKRARRVIEKILQHPLDQHGVINVNIPVTESEDGVAGDGPDPEIRVVEMNTAPGTDGYERRESPGRQTYYWSSGSGMEFTHTGPDTDVEALFERCITVTPLQFNLTDYARLQSWRERLGCP